MSVTFGDTEQIERRGTGGSGAVCVTLCALSPLPVRRSPDAVRGRADAAGAAEPPAPPAPQPEASQTGAGEGAGPGRAGPPV